MKRDSILENNMVQTIGSAGESLLQVPYLPCLPFSYGRQNGGWDRPA